MKTALLVGASGLVGSFVLQKLLDDSRYEKVVIFGRKSVNITHKNKYGKNFNPNIIIGANTPKNVSFSKIRVT